jgi:hypothetical protein
MKFGEGIYREEKPAGRVDSDMKDFYSTASLTTQNIFLY